jgi:hypothetical protein
MKDIKEKGEKRKAPGQLLTSALHKIESNLAIRSPYLMMSLFLTDIVFSISPSIKT